LQTKRSRAVPPGKRARWIDASAWSCSANDEIELPLEGERADIGDFEREISIGPRELPCREVDHGARWIDAHRGASRKTGGDGCGDLAITTADVENTFVAAQRQLAEHFLGHRLLQARMLMVLICVPLGHDDSLNQQLRAMHVVRLSRLASWCVLERRVVTSAVR
jgi:hypothetical protein